MSVELIAEEEHQCGGPREACGEPGCAECGTAASGTAARDALVRHLCARMAEDGDLYWLCGPRTETARLLCAAAAELTGRPVEELEQELRRVTSTRPRTLFARGETGYSIEGRLLYAGEARGTYLELADGSRVSLRALVQELEMRTVSGRLEIPYGERVSVTIARMP